MTSGPSKWIRKDVLDMHAYHVPPAAGVIKLNAMENPYGWPAHLVEPLQAHLAEVSVNRYPDPTASELSRVLRSVFGVKSHHGLLLGNGSDELIQLLIMGVADEGRTVMSPGPTFVMYEHLSKALRVNYVSLDLTASFELDVDSFLDGITRHQPAIVFLAYPNNPTGNLFPPASVRQIIEAAPGLVVVDEAYEAFAGQSAIDWLDEYPNLIVLRTLSKSGLAGLRLGFMVGAQAWIDQFEKLRLPYNINVLTQATGEFALEHYAAFLEQTQQLVTDRGHLASRLKALAGVRPFASQTNFILFAVPNGTASAVLAGVLEHGVLIKSFDGTHPLLQDCLRVTVGTAEENDKFVAALAAVVGDL